MTWPSDNDQPDQPRRPEEKPVNELKKPAENYKPLQASQLIVESNIGNIVDETIDYYWKPMRQMKLLLCGNEGLPNIDPVIVNDSC